MPAVTTPELLRSLGLEVDGPVRWGALPARASPGVFAVEGTSALPSAPLDLVEVRRWIERVPSLRLDDGPATPSALARRLAAFWLPGQSLLYVGRTSKSLAARIASLYATELGFRRPHPGGHWLKTLQDLPRLRVWWAETDASEEYEDAILGAFAEAVPEESRLALPDGAPVLPWASLESPSGARRETGISGSLREPDTTVRDSAVRRSDPSGTIRRRMPARVASTPVARQGAARQARPKAASAGSGQPPTHVTAEGMAALQTELERLRTVERPAVVERIKHARELGDLRENADYEAARREQSFLEGRIIELEHRLRTAVVIRSDQGRSVIALGSRVSYAIDGVAGRLTIVGSTESDPSAGLISAASPVGRALLGRRVGDDVVVTTPGAEIVYRILEVS
jgi:transcription elongation factor GreA